MDGNWTLGALAPQIALAAAGFIDAQRELLHNALNELRQQFQAGRRDADLAAYEVLLWARMLASRGTQEDILMLAAALNYVARALLIEGREDRSNILQAEALAVLEGLSAAGSEEATLIVNDVVPMLSPEVVAVAEHMRREFA